MYFRSNSSELEMNAQDKLPGTYYGQPKVIISLFGGGGRENSHKSYHDSLSRVKLQVQTHEHHTKLNSSSITNQS